MPALVISIYRNKRRGCQPSQTETSQFHKQFARLTFKGLNAIFLLMKDGGVDPFYRAFGDLVRLHREGRPDLTQEKLGRLVGLSRTSITNIEKGRQHIALHQLFALADALKVRPEALLPASGGAGEASWLTKKLPAGTEKNITQWAEKLIGESSK